MFNPFNALPLWRALRHFSLTFALVFALALLGVSVNAHLRHLLSELPVPFYAVWIGPALLLGYIAKNERRWLPNELLRRRLAWGMVAGAVVVFLVMATVRHVTAPPPGPEEEQQQVAPTRPTHRGPAGK